MDRIHILYVNDNVSEVNHFVIYRIQVGWVNYALFFQSLNRLSILESVLV